MHQLCKSAQWQTVYDVITDYLGMLTGEMIGLHHFRNEDLSLTRAQAKAQAVTGLFNEFARLDALAGQLEFKEGNEDGNQG